jgi:hypothetical protein
MQYFYVSILSTKNRKYHFNYILSSENKRNFYLQGLYFLRMIHRYFQKNILKFIYSSTKPSFFKMLILIIEYSRGSQPFVNPVPVDEHKNVCVPPNTHIIFSSTTHTHSVIEPFQRLMGHKFKLLSASLSFFLPFYTKMDVFPMFFF